MAARGRYKLQYVISQQWFDGFFDGKFGVLTVEAALRLYYKVGSIRPQGGALQTPKIYISTMDGRIHTKFGVPIVGTLLRPHIKICANPPAGGAITNFAL